MNTHTRKRLQLWDREVARSIAAQCGELPICNLCGLPVQKDQAWHESHEGDKPKAFGGTQTGIAHKRCNLSHGAAVVKPQVTKHRNVRARDTGSYRPSKPWPGGRESWARKTIGGQVVVRLSGLEKHRALMAKRKI